MDRPNPHAAPRPAVWRRPRLLLLLAAALALGLALLRPGLTLPRPAPRTLAVVDITGSMAVRDLGPADARRSRLEAVQALLAELIATLPCGPQLGLGVFTERKTLVLMAPVEVCRHRAALLEAVEALDLRTAWAADSHLFYGVYSALDQIRSRWPGTRLAFFSDGDQAPPFFPGREPAYERRPDTPGGVLVAVGSALPQPVPRFDAEGRLSGYWTAEDAASFASTGAPVLSVKDLDAVAGGDRRNAGQRPAGAAPGHLSARQDAVLAQVAERTGLGLIQADAAGAVRTALAAPPGVSPAPRRVELHDPLVALALILALAGLGPAWRWRRRAAAGRRRRPAPPAPARPDPPSR